MERYKFYYVLITVLLVTGSVSRMAAQQVAKSTGVHIVTNTANIYKVVTGDYTVSYKTGASYFSIHRRGKEGLQGKFFTLQPGGGNKEVDVFNPSQISKFTCAGNGSNISLTVTGKNSWCTYSAIVSLPKNNPGLINSKLMIQVLPGKKSPADVFKGQYPELAYVQGKAKVSPRLTYYFNSTPHAFTYHTIKEDSASIPDFNQFLYFGDDEVLGSTVQQYVDFTSLNDYYKQSGTVIFNSVRQPAGSLAAAAEDEQGNTGTFGFDIPESHKALIAGKPLLVSNSWLILKSGSPKINEPTVYCKRFAEGVSTIYDHIQKPEHKFYDWPKIVEQGYQSLVKLKKEHNKQILFHQANMGSIQRYNQKFGSPTGDALMANSDDEWNRVQTKLPYGDAWQYLFPLIMAGEYGNEFNNEAARKVFLAGADNVVLAGQKLNYVFPLRIKADFSNPDNWRNQYDCTGAYVYLMLMYHDATKKQLYLDEAKKAGDRLLKMGFEFPFEFTTTALGPLGMIRLYKATGEAKYREGAYIPMAAILRHTWLFNPGYREYSGRNIFMLTEGMPTVYANGWEEAVMLRYMNLLLLEGKDVLTKPITNMTMQLLRWKCVSMADGMVPLLPDSTIIYKGIPREWSLPVDPASYIPVEGFGYLEWDFSGQHDKLGRVSQGPYCFGMLPEAAMLLFHPIGKQVQFYCEVPVAINKKDANTVSFSTITGDGTYQCRILKKTGITVMVTPREAGGPVKLVDDKNSGWLNFSAKAGTAYTIQVTNH